MVKKTSAARELVAAVSSGDIEKADVLLSAGCNLNEKVDGMTALHFIVGSRASISGFRWLITNGAALNERDGNQLTPLMVVCGRKGTTAKRMALELIAAGCDVTYRRDIDSMSAMEFAAKNSEPEVIRALFEHGGEIDGDPEGDVFPALMATRSGNLANLETLVELGCDLTKATQLSWARGLTCLGIARLERHQQIVKYLERIGAP